MLFDPATDAEIRSAQIVTSVTMAAFVAAQVFGRHARRVRMAVTGIYLAAFLVFAVYTIF